MDLLGSKSDVARVGIKLEANKLKLSSPENDVRGAEVVHLKVRR